MQQKEPDGQFTGKMIKGYDFLNIIGRGKYGEVYLALNSKKQQVAIKVIQKIRLENKKKLIQLLKTQIKVLSSVKNENVITFYQNFQNNTHIFIVTEFCDGGNLQDYLKLKQKLPQEEAIMFLKQILNGFKGLHQVGAIHRDFKIANILLHHDACKIADLGFAKILEDQYGVTTTVLGTPLYMAPQILERKPYGKLADIWSVGVFFYMILFGNFPYIAQRQAKLYEKIVSSRPSFQGAEISEEARDFINKCLTVDPKKRITWQQIYEHPIIKEKQSVIYGVLKSKVQLKKNKFFYDEPERQMTPSSPEKDFKKYDQNVRNSQDQKLIQKQAQQIRNRDQAFIQIEKKYLSKRNSIMFAAVYINPLIRTLFNVKGIHFQCLILLLKATYLQLDLLQYHIKKKKNIFEIQKYWDQFSKRRQYEDLLVQIKEDKHIISAYWQYHKQEFAVCRQQVKSQKQLESTQNKKFKQMVKTYANQYWYELVKQLPNFLGRKKQILIRLMSALMYFVKEDHPVISQFDRLLSLLNYQKAELGILAKAKNK